MSETSKERVSDSRIQCLRQCPRKHYYQYILRRAPIRRSNALSAGGLFHSAMEADLTGQEFLFPQQHEYLSPSEMAVMRAVWRFSKGRWPNDWEVIEVETKYRFDLGDGWEVVGVVDVLAMLPDGRMAVVDHKTTSSMVGPGSTYEEQQLLKFQPYLYMRLTGASLAYMNVYRKPRLRIRAKETHAEYSERCYQSMVADPETHHQMIEVSPTERQWEEFDADFELHVADIKRASESRDPLSHARNTNSCHAYNTQCEYYRVCSHTASIDDATLYDWRE